MGHTRTNPLGAACPLPPNADMVRKASPSVKPRRTRRLFPFIERIYGDGGYRGPKAAKAAAKTGDWTIEIVERSSTAVGFEVLPKRWIVNA
jgi:transposase